MEGFEIWLDGTTVIVWIPMRFHRRGGRKRIVARDGSEIAPATKRQPDGTWSRHSRGRGAGRSCSMRGVYASVTETPGALAAVNRHHHLLRRRGAGGRCLDHAAIAPRRFAIQPRR